MNPIRSLEQEGIQSSLLTVIIALSEAVKEFRDWLDTGDWSLSGKSNSRGDEQLKADEKANEIFVTKLQSTCKGLIAGVISEESEEVIEIDPEAPYWITLDPMDGSKNLQINGPFGTIIGILEESENTEALQIKASMCATYGVRTDIYVAVKGCGVDGFSLGKNGQFMMKWESMWMEESGGIYVPGKLIASWPSEYRALIEQLEQEAKKVRNFGALVCDFINILHNGGWFVYPPGKLMTLCELLPIALVIEEAGGTAIDGKQRILAKIPKSVNELTENWKATSAMIMGPKANLSQANLLMNMKLAA